VIVNMTISTQVMNEDRRKQTHQAGFQPASPRFLSQGFISASSYRPFIARVKWDRALNSPTYSLTCEGGSLTEIGPIKLLRAFFLLSPAMNVCSNEQPFPNSLLLTLGDLSRPIRQQL
jgi:hypothetical protein